MGSLWKDLSMPQRREEATVCMVGGEEGEVDHRVVGILKNTMTVKTTLKKALVTRTHRDAIVETHVQDHTMVPHVEEEESGETEVGMTERKEGIVKTEWTARVTGVVGEGEDHRGGTMTDPATMMTDTLLEDPGMRNMRVEKSQDLVQGEGDDSHAREEVVVGKENQERRKAASRRYKTQRQSQMHNSI
uniref:Uncharacterized protein n=1 Tax=Cacopsylla melanoneura TaxID=428564 RepID=A0A8D9F5D0_9HEMI